MLRSLTTLDIISACSSVNSGPSFFSCVDVLFLSELTLHSALSLMIVRKLTPDRFSILPIAASASDCLDFVPFYINLSNLLML